MSKIVSFQEFWSLRHAAGGAFFTRWVSQRLGAVLAWIFCRIGLSPSVATLLGLCIFVVGVAAYVLLPKGWIAIIACIALFQLGYAVDCADGQLARATGCTTVFGAWLDLACDHVRNLLAAMAVMVWLINGFGIDELAATLPSAILASGLAVQLHTVTVLRQTSTKTSPGPMGARQFLVAMIDTPVFLTGLCLLRDNSRLLTGYAFLMGGAYLAAGVLQARRRLTQGSGQP